MSHENDYAPRLVPIHHSGRTPQEDAVVELLREQPRTRVDIAELLETSRTALARVLAPLLDTGVVLSRSIETRGRGRPTEMLSLGTETICGIGIDINRQCATMLAVNALDEDLTRLVIPASGDWRTDLETLVKKFVRFNLKRYAQAPHISMGIGLPHPFGSTRVPKSAHDDIIEYVREFMGIYFPGTRPFVDNTVRMAAVAEAQFVQNGAMDNVLYIRIADGIMGAATINGYFALGSAGHAGEVGHVTVPGAQGACHCGKIGCLETVATAPKLLALSGQGKLLDLANAWEHHDPAATHAIVQAADATAHICAQAIFFLNPESIILSGSVVESLPAFLPLLQNSIQNLLIKGINANTRITKAQASPEDCARGAIIAARQWDYAKAGPKAGPAS
ncbi:MAG: ROK family transcriptional regulator [Corynebacterium sp.]|nr:ROK family transcriptional regulator [Corynebacterium sp.]